VKRDGVIATAWVLFANRSTRHLGAVRFDYDLQLYEFNCSTDQYRLGQTNKYVLSSDIPTLTDNLADGGWQSVAPDTVAHRLEQVSCETSALGTPIVADASSIAAAVQAVSPPHP
jgi:hypothetical protein